ARTVVIVGLVATFVGILEAISIYLLVFAIIVSVGWMLGRKLPGEQIGFLMEMAPLRMPKPRAVMLKTWIHMRGFVLRAFPLLIVGSAALGVIDEAGLLDVFQNVVAPISVGLLGLPAFAATALVFGFLRKEMAVSILAVMAGTAYFPEVMTGLQLYVFALVTTIYVPCIATVAVLKHELGLKSTMNISVFTILLAIVVGGIVNFIGTVIL
ncbi:MAG: ferrous iron transporter B, partial [Methanosarcinales archaeon]|nr:ferrous iron transporter B [Methanosarcinales archaeon]